MAKKIDARPHMTKAGNACYSVGKREFREAVSELLGFEVGTIKDMGPYSKDYMFFPPYEEKAAAKPSQQGGNIPVHDAEVQLAIKEWVECILEGDATLDAVPLVIRDAVGRGLQPTNLRPPQKVKQPESLRPPGKGKGEKMAASGASNVSRAAEMAALKRDLKRKMSGR